MTADQQSDVIKLQMAAKRTAEAATASAAYHASAPVTQEDLAALLATQTQDIVAAVLAALQSGGVPLALNPSVVCSQPAHSNTENLREPVGVPVSVPAESSPLPSESVVNANGKCDQEEFPADADAAESKDESTPLRDFKPKALGDLEEEPPVDDALGDLEEEPPVDDALGDLAELAEDENERLAVPDVNMHDTTGRTALHNSVGEGNCKIVRLLLAHKDLNVNQPDAEGATALFTAVREGNCKVVRLLLAHKDVIVDCADAASQTPLQAAERGGFREIAALLKKAGATHRAPPFVLSSAKTKSRTAPGKAKSKGSKGGKGGKDKNAPGKGKGKEAAPLAVKGAHNSCNDTIPRMHRFFEGASDTTLS